MLAGVVAASAAEWSRIAAPQGGAASIKLEFRAVTDDGQPVLDLKPEELSLRIGGRDRKVSGLNLVQLASGRGGAAPAAPAPAAPARVLPPPFASNGAAGDGGNRSVLIILEAESVPPGREQPVRDAIGQLLSGLGPRDEVALMVMPRGGTLVEPTSQHGAVTAALAKMVGRKSLGESSSDAACRARDALDAIKGLFASLAGAASTTVVYASFGMTAPGGGSGQCAITTASFQELTPSVHGSRANFYVVHIMDGGGDNQGLGNLASTTGGELIRFTGLGETAMARISRETSAYYVLSFDAEAADRTGNPQRVELRIPGRDRVRVRTRQDIAIAKSTAAPSPRDMIREVKAYRDLPLRANAYLSRNQGDDKLKTIVLFESSDPGVTIKAASVVLFDEKGKGVSQWNGNADDFKSQPIMAAPGPALPAGGTYRLRVAAVDSAGRAGAVDTEVHVDLPATGPIKLSTMILGMPSATGPIDPRLQFGPADQAAIGYVEVYGVPEGAKVTAAYELAESIDAPPMATGQANVAQGKDLLFVRGGFGIGPLPPGDYIIRVVINVDGKEVGRTARTLRKVAK
jgi:hypothetical protein